jgi:hypothetical protein
MKKPPRFWIEHVADWKSVPMAFWVHIEKGDKPWYRATEFDPPAPKTEGRRGYPVLCVESCGMVFRFSSREQLEACIQTLAMKPLPSVKRLIALRYPGIGLNSHWLARLPASVKSPKGRQQAVADLSAVARARQTARPQ